MPSPKRNPPPDPADVQEFEELQQRYERLKEEHDILKKAIRFTSERRGKSSSSSKRTNKASRSE